MPKIGGAHTETIDITGSGRTWTFKSNFVVDVPTGGGISEQAGLKNNTIIMHGIAQSYAGDNAIYLQGKNTRLEISEDGRIRGDGTAITSVGRGAEIVNEGTIKGSEDYGSVKLAGDHSVFRNSGTVVETVSTFGEKSLLVNGQDGSISSSSAGRTAVSIGQGEAGGKFINHGTVENLGDPGAGAIYAGDHNDTLINDGKIVGNVALGDGNDLMDNRGGKHNGDYYGNLGNDVLITDKASDTLLEFAGQGFDKVKSTVTYTLSENVEYLVLIGKKNIDARGNDDVGVNYLVGNSGDNTLWGFEGGDMLDGKAGNDVLRGGSGRDMFVFKTGYDKDTIYVFEPDEEQIDVSGWKAIDNFGDIRSHAKNHGDDVWITAGDDILVIGGMHKADLAADDFIF